MTGHGREKPSEGALTTAAPLTVRLGAHLHVGHVIEPRDYPADPARILAAVADEHDALMIVVGSAGRGPAAAVRHSVHGGPAARALLRPAHRPVLVVPVPRDGSR